MHTFKHFLILAAPFWWRKSQWREWLLLIAVIALSLAIVHTSVLINSWNKTFYDALAAFNGRIMPTLIAEFLGYIAFITLCVALGNWLRKILLWRWRAHLTHQFEQHWLSNRRHYHLQLTGEPDNPDQRIAEDIYLLSESSIDLCKYFIMNAAKLSAFIAVLWQLSGIQTFSYAGYHFTIHGYLVWVALIYSILCTWLTHLIGRPLHRLNIERQHREADYRATLLRVRDHSEPIAFYRGEAAEQDRLSRRFNRVGQNWQQLIAREMKLESFSAAYLRLSMFIPIIATLPMYLARSMTFGDMMQARSAFSSVQDGFGWFMDYYKRIMAWSAVVARLSQFQTALNTLPEVKNSLEETITSNTSLSLQQLNIFRTDGCILLANLNLHAQAGDWILLNGNSGIGKSTLLRTLAGLWPYYQGHFQLKGERILFLPQRPYLPHDSLRNTVSYPANNYSDHDIQTALTQVGLSHLSQDLNNIQEWQRILSGGEQQRLSLARALLYRPHILLLDEATNQLDDCAATQLMHNLHQQFPNSLCLAISHQNSIHEFFTQKLDLHHHSN